MLQLREEEGERKGALVAGAEGVPEARFVERGLLVAQLDGRAIDQNLVAGAGYPAGIAVLGCPRGGRVTSASTAPLCS